MYFEHTTISERDVIRDNLCSSFVRLNKLGRLLEGLSEDYFSDRKQRPLHEAEAEDVADRLFVVSEVLSNVLTEYDLMTCSDSYRANLHRESQEREKLARRCSELCEKLIDTENRMGLEKRKAAEADRTKAMDLPDEQAAPILEELLRRTHKNG